MFEILDANDSGEITRENLLKFCDFNDLALSNQELELLFRRVDKNEDGLITFGDFVKEMGI